MSSFSRGCVLPCIALEINRNSSKFCRLPRGIAEELGHISSRIACLRVTWLEELSDVPSLYFAWNGSICSGTGVDAALEIPGTAFEGEDGAWALEALRSFGRGSEDPVMVEVQLVERIEDATAIELLPTSYQDWDIVSARAMVVEELLLRQMSMVVLANTFTLQLDGTMEVSFQVSMLETASTRRSLEDGGEQDDGLPKQNLIALLNQHTFVSVVPLERPKDGREASEEELQRNYEAQIEALKAKCIEHIQNSSSTQPLSVLPSSLRSVDTSFHASVTVGEGAKDRDYKIRAEYQRKGEVVVAKDSVFDECLDLLSSSHSTEEASSVSGSEVGKEDDDASILQIQKSGTTCLVHPSFLSNLLRCAVNAAMPDRVVDEAVRQEVLARLESHYGSSGNLLVEVTSFDEESEFNASIGDSKDTRGVKLRLCEDSGVRPGSVSLPPCLLTAGQSKNDSVSSSCKIVTAKILSTSMTEVCIWSRSSEQAEATGPCLSLRTVTRGYTSSKSDQQQVPEISNLGPHLRSLQGSFRVWLEAEMKASRHLEPSVVALSSNILLRLRCVASPNVWAPHEAEYLLEVGGEGMYGLPVLSKGQEEDEEQHIVEALRLSERLQLSPSPSISLLADTRPSGPLSADDDSSELFTAMPRAPPGLEIPLRGLLLALLPSLHPGAVLARLTRGENNPALGILRDGNTTEYPRSVLLCGPSGSGKSTVVDTLTSILGSSARTLALVSSVSCRDLAHRVKSAGGTKAAFQALSYAFKDALEASEKSARPTVILLEDLDALCAAPGAGGEDGGEGTNYDERAALFSLHLEQLLCRVAQRSRTCTEKALTSLTVPSPVPTAHDHHHYHRQQQQALLSYFRGAVVVVATCQQEERLSARLRNSKKSSAEVRDRALFTHSVHIPPVSRSARIPLLKHALQADWCSLAPLQETSGAGVGVGIGGLAMEQEELLLEATEGLVRRDFFRVARRLLLLKATGAGSSSSSSNRGGFPLPCTVEEVVAECRAHLGTSSGSDGSDGKARTGGSASWSHVGGLWQVKSAILEVLRAPVLYWKLYKGSPVRLPRGVLLYGPPGCGKTYLANAVAAHCGLQMISVAGPELLGKYIGSSEKAVRDVFTRAQVSGKPTLIFFDELESLAPKRGTDNTGVTDRVVNQLLTFLDGAEQRPGEASSSSAGKDRKGNEDEKDEENKEDDEDDSTGRNLVYIMAATSRPDLIDKALLRPGRIETHLYVGQPDDREREEIVMKALSRYPTDEGQSYLDAGREGGGGESDDMDVHAASRWICAEEKAQAMVSADFSALVSTAFLAATHEAIEGGDKGKGRSGGDGGIRLRGRHLLAAFKELRPSLASKDMNFYRKVHASFGQGKGPQTDTGAVPSSSVITPKKKALMRASGQSLSEGDDGGGVFEAGGFVGLPLGYVPAYGGSPLRAQYSSGQSPSRRQIVRGVSEGSGYDSTEAFLSDEMTMERLERLRQTAGLGDDMKPADPSATFDVRAPQRTTLM